jgi:hypothetical protein
VVYFDEVYLGDPDQDASVFVDPMTSPGDMIMRSEGNVTIRRGAGTTGQSLKVDNDAIPYWSYDNYSNNASSFTPGLEPEIMSVDTTASARTVTLRTAIGISGKKYRFIKTGSATTNLLTISTIASQTIGLGSQQTVTLAAPYAYIDCVRWGKLGGV